MRFFLNLIAIASVVAVRQIQGLPKSLQDRQNLETDTDSENVKTIIAMKNPESWMFNFRSGDEEINKLEFLERETDPTPVGSVTLENALEAGVKLIESANYECHFSEQHISNKAIVCKEKPQQSKAIKTPLLSNLESEPDISESGEGFFESADEMVFKLEELFAKRMSNLTSFVFNPAAQPEERFQNCTTPTNETGHCRYIQHCLIPSILGNLNHFMEYVCIIEGAFIGVCCPELPVTEVTVERPENETCEVKKANNTAQAESECGTATNVRIVGGSNADRKAWPWMVALLTKSQESFFCGGVLINTRYVLTAAHCTFGIPKNMITARVGEYDLKAQVHLIHEDYAVIKMKRHGQYSQRTLQNDIALLLLEKEVTFNPFIMTICLPEKNFDYVNRTATLAGWGNLEGGGPTSDVLQVASFPVIANADCQSDHGVPIDDSAICTGSDDKGACNGDSGGPLMLLDDNERWKTIAIVSWGRRGCNPKFPTVYTRVSFYLDWIKKHGNVSDIS